MDPQSTSPLALLPVELLLRIMRSVDTETLASLRLSCKRIEQSLFHFFSREFFSKKQFMLTDESLQALVSISQHEALSPTLRHVVIGLDKADTSNVVLFGTTEQSMRYAATVARQSSLISTGAAKDMLQMAFSNLKNLTTVDIRDFNAPSRYRDGPNSQWSSFGSTTIYNETGIRIPMDSHTQSYPSSVFLTVLAALSQAGSYPESIEVLLRNRRWGMHDCAFDLTPRGNVDPVKVVSKLRKLHLDIDSTPQAALMFPTVPGSDGSAPYHHLDRFLTRARDLRWLRINFQQGLFPTCDAFIDTFGRHVQREFSPPLSKLERLDLGNAEVSLPALVGAIVRFPSLTALSLWKITILHDAHTVQHPNLWAEGLQQIAKAGCLNWISVGYATQRSIRTPRLPVTFNGKTTFLLSGQEALSEALENIANGTVLVVPPEDDDSMSEDDDGNEDDEDSEDSDNDGNNNETDGDEE